MERLTPLQRTLVACVAANPGRFNRSELARLLVGSASARVASWQEHPDYGRLAGHGRKRLAGELDSLVQQGFLRVDGRGRLVMGTGR